MSSYIVEAIKNGIFETLQMTFFASLLSYVIGLPLGILLYSTSKGRILSNRPLNLIFGLIVNICRSLPFLILLVLLIPFTRFVTGSSIGTTASIVPLTVGAVPIVARMVESSLSEVSPGIIEAAVSMGASPIYIIVHFILPEATPSLLLVQRSIFLPCSDIPQWQALSEGEDSEQSLCNTAITDIRRTFSGPRSHF